MILFIKELLLSNSSYYLLYISSYLIDTKLSNETNLEKKIFSIGNLTELVHSKYLKFNEFNFDLYIKEKNF